MTINFLNIAQVLVAIALIGFILIQRGPGATAGSAFGGGGGGASGTVFGAKGSGSFLTKATAVLATMFFIITMLIAIDASGSYSSSSDTAEKDLGVFGTLDVDGLDSTVQPVDATDVDTQINNALDAAERTSDEVIDEVDQATDEVMEDASDATNEVIDEETSAGDADDGGTN